MDKILANVLSNAFKFTPEGGSVEVRVQSRPSKEVSAVTIAIADTGIGIPKDHLARSSTGSIRWTEVTPENREGRASALALTKELIELHKGRIEVESEEGKGSTFKLVFPLGKAHLKPEEIGVAEAGHEQEAPIPRVDDNVVIGRSTQGRGWGIRQAGHCPQC